ILGFWISNSNCRGCQAFLKNRAGRRLLWQAAFCVNSYIKIRLPPDFDVTILFYLFKIPKNAPLICGGDVAHKSMPGV
ncbi:MAG TPA: hypothetical protein VFX82_09915, partial [Desulfobacterales bacterium]|nr:hypothetical protein [Desulfobacterales bacterium]